MRAIPLALLSALSLAFGLLLLPQESVQGQAEPTPRPLYALPDARTTTATESNTFAQTSSRVLVVANMLSNTVSFVAPLSGEVLGETPVGEDPRNVAITGDSTRALVTNRLSGTLSVVDVEAQTETDVIPLHGAWPMGVVVDGNDIAYVSMQGTNEVLVVDINASEVRARIPTARAPAGLALWGDFLYITHLWSGDLSLVYLPQQEVVSTISTGGDTGMSPTVTIDITRGLAYLPQTRSYDTNPNLTFDTTVFPIVNVLQLGGLSLIRQERIALDTADRPVNMPYATALNRFSQLLYVANAGSNDVSVIDLESGLARGNVEVGANPRGMLLNRDNTFLYVHNVLDGTITTIETSTLNVVDELPVTDLTLPIDILIGSQLFHSANDPRMSADRWISCANCHLEGQTDGRVWTGFPDGPTNTPLLFNLGETAPYNWQGTWDEIADTELKIRDLQAGLGLIEPPDTVNEALGDPHTSISLDLDTLVIYLETLRGPLSPYTQDAEAIARGEELFVEQECNTCHALPTGTDMQSHDVGTGGTFDTPSVRWLWLSAPYFHDGRAATLDDVFELPGQHQLIRTLPAEDIADLITYLRSLPTDLNS